MPQKDFAVVILAAGRGKRMGGDAPKVLRMVGDKPVIQRLVDTVLASGVTDKPTVVVCDENTLIQDTLGQSCDYAVQAEQLGTGHAVACSRPFLEGNAKRILVFYGDMPFVSKETILKLKEMESKDDGVLILFTTEVVDFAEWRQSFYNFGRIIRDENGKIIAIREKKDCQPEELEIKEVNPGFYCFDAVWLWPHLGKLDNKNSQSEFYLTDLVKQAMSEGHEIHSIKIDPRECIGINTPEDLALANKLYG